MMNNLSIYPSKQGLGWVFACQDGLFGKNHMQNADLCIKNVAWGWVRHMTSKICRIDVNKKIFDVGISHSNPVSVRVLAIRQSQQKFSISKIDLAAAESSVYAPHSEKTLLCAQHPIYKYIGRVTLSPIIFISGCVGGDEKNIIISSTQNDHVPSSPNGLVLSLDLGTQTRWAVGGHDGIMSSGTKSHKPSRFEGLRSNCSVKKCREAF